MCWITSLPENIIKRIVSFLNHDDARSLNQTCKPLCKYVLHKDVLHKDVPPSTQVIDVNDPNKLKNRDLALSEVLILDEIPPDSELFNLIRDCCPKLKYLFIKYSCERDVLMLNFENLLCVEISIKINMFRMNCKLSIWNLPSTVESFTAHISGIDPVTFKTIPVGYKRTIDLNISNLENLKSL
jgi:hypothetical protein